jgi:hypothetical protein
MLDEKGELKTEVLRKIALRAGIIGSVVWGFFYVLAGIMFVSLGLWPIVVWPFVVYFYSRHLLGVVAVVQNASKPKAQTVNFNIRTEQTAEEIADAASKAMSNETYWNLNSR